ncbi:PAS domain-containing protein [Curvivirga aplysinae]|uniref:hypothetical protein n=1 Tax=Curvivirga aplysinae TaxID=2529852 RepID=UPI0012BB8F50|nr:hypothetical protein [Curvivirga aplysinae]MTI08595.1 hypothetical protein [Curvivirga aplysinae]
MSLEIKSSLLQELYDHWFDLNAGAIPQENLLDPSSFPKKLFPFISLYEVTQEPRRYYAKIVGNGLIHYANVDYRNKYLDELPIFNFLSEIIDWYDTCIDAEIASVKHLPFKAINDENLPAERLFLPYKNLNGQISKFIAASILEVHLKTHTLP